MKDIFLKHLFEKHIFVETVGEADINNQSAFETVFSLAKMFQIKVVSGGDMAEIGMIKLASEMLGTKVPAPFYEGFPRSVRSLSEDELLFDQLLSYAKTYGIGDFSSPVHSELEDYIERNSFNEKVPAKEFIIVSETAAKERLREDIEDLLRTTRPLAEDKFELLVSYIKEYDYTITFCESKNTVIRLIATLGDETLSDYIVMSDVIKLLEEISYKFYENENIKKLNLKNKHRKLIRAVMDRLVVKGKVDLKNCYEKKAIWSGLLHHIHYRPETKEAREFVDAMRGKVNDSAYSTFEKHMALGEIREAMSDLQNDKGGAAVLRKLNYIVSRCQSQEEINYVIDNLESVNKVVLLQLYMQYTNPVRKCNGRVFQYTRFNMLKVHKETVPEVKKRKSFVSDEIAGKLCIKIKEILAKTLHNKLGKVYIDESMKNIALPIKESTSSGGYGILPKGSRIPFPEAKKIRAFTYWEKVDDIDLSVIGVTKDGMCKEFSWRTMYGNQSEAITYSGDTTSGYDGGSEYFDVDLESYKEEHPNIDYLVFCNNVYSRVNFSKVICRAGYMLRDIEDSGEVFEPKTVETSFTINAESTFAYLFGIDLGSNELVWLNTARNSSATVAGATDVSFLTDYFYITSYMNVHKLFEMMATELVDSPDKADVVISDNDYELSDEISQVHSYDIEKIMSYIG